MIVSCKLIFKYKDNSEASLVAGAVAPDNYQFVSSRVEGSELISVIESKSILSLLHTLNDYFTCIKVAEELARIGCAMKKIKSDKEIAEKQRIDVVKRSHVRRG